MTKQFLVVYAKCHGSNFAGQAPDVLGCVSTGDTLEEMRAMMKEALEFHFESMVEDGDSLPEPKTTSLDFTTEDFDGVEYFIVEHLDLTIPQINAARSAMKHALSA